MDPLNDNVASLLHQSSDHFVSELWKEGESDLLSFIHCHVQQTFNLCVRSVQICEKISFKLKNKNVVIPCIFFFFFKIVKYKERSLQVQNVLTISLSSPSLLFNYSIYLTVWSSLVLLPSCSLLCLLALFPFVLLFSLFTNLVLTSFLPSDLSPCAFLLPASDIQTLPRVYFFDSYATLQANGSDSRFLSSSVCHTDIPHSHLCLHHSFVFCLPSFWLLCAFSVTFYSFLVDILSVMLHDVTYC